MNHTHLQKYYLWL